MIFNLMQFSIKKMKRISYIFTCRILNARVIAQTAHNGHTTVCIISIHCFLLHVVSCKRANIVHCDTTALRYASCLHKWKKTRPYSTVGIRIACIFTSDDIAIFHLRVLAFVFVFVFVFVVVSNALHWLISDGVSHCSDCKHSKSLEAKFFFLSNVALMLMHSRPWIQMKAVSIILMDKKIFYFSVHVVLR